MTQDQKKPFNSPFAALTKLGYQTPPPDPTPEPQPAAKSSSKPARPAAKGPQVIESPAGTIPRAVVRLERSGRGGKEVTVIEHLALASAARDVWLKALKAGLGCGGVVEGDALVLQGDQRDRLPKLLAQRGVKKITVA